MLRMIVVNMSNNDNRQKFDNISSPVKINFVSFSYTFIVIETLNTLHSSNETCCASFTCVSIRMF